MHAYTRTCAISILYPRIPSFTQHHSETNTFVRVSEISCLCSSSSSSSVVHSGAAKYRFETFSCGRNLWIIVKDGSSAQRRLFPFAYYYYYASLLWSSRLIFAFAMNLMILRTPSIACCWGKKETVVKFDAVLTTLLNSTTSLVISDVATTSGPQAGVR